MKIDKKKIVKYMGAVALVSAISLTSGAIITEIVTDHEEEICPITNLMDNLGLQGSLHQKEKITNDYLKIHNYQEATTDFIPDYHSRYVCFELFQDGFCSLYNIDTKKYEDVLVNLEDFDQSYIGIKEYYVEKEVQLDHLEDNMPDDYYFSLTEDGPKIYKTILVMETIEPEIIHTSFGLTYKLPEGYTLQKMYISKKPEEVYKVTGLNQDGEEEISYLKLQKK